MSLTLFTLNRNCSSSLGACLDIMQPGDGLLLLEEAVYLLANSGKPTLDTVQIPEKFRLCLLEEDLAARGLSARINPRYTVVNYPAFVGLCLEFGKVVNW